MFSEKLAAIVSNFKVMVIVRPVIKTQRRQREMGERILDTIAAAW